MDGQWHFKSAAAAAAAALAGSSMHARAVSPMLSLFSNQIKSNQI